MCPERYQKPVLSEFVEHTTSIGELLRVKVKLSIVCSVAVIQLKMGACETMLGDVRGIAQQLLLSYSRLMESPCGPQWLFEHFR